MPIFSALTPHVGPDLNHLPNSCTARALCLRRPLDQRLLVPHRMTLVSVGWTRRRAGAGGQTWHSDHGSP